MSELSKRLQNSLNRIKNRGGYVMVHHTPTAVEYQLQGGRSLSPNVVKQLVEAGVLESGRDGLFGDCDQTMHVRAA